MKLKAALAALMILMGAILTACGPLPGSRVPGDPGVPTAHAILTVTVRDSKGDLIVPAESPHWPNVVISVLGEDAHGDPPLNWTDLERINMTENPWVRDISWPVGSVAKATGHAQTDIQADAGTTIEVAWSHTDGRPCRGPGCKSTDLNPGPGRRGMDVVVHWVVAIEGPA